MPTFHIVLRVWGRSMEWRLFIVVLMVPFLASCGMAQQMQINAVADTAVETQRRALAECRAISPDPHKKPLTPRVKCFATAFNARTDTLLNTVGNPIADIEYAYSAQIVALAERYDRGGMTESQLDAEMSQLGVNSQNLYEARRNNAIAAHAAQQQADAARYNATMQGLAAGAAIMAPPPIAPAPVMRPTNTRCTAYGNTMNCQNW